MNSIRTITALLLSCLLFNAFAQDCTTTPCANNGTCISYTVPSAASYCSCRSGNGDSSCSTSADPSCTFNSISALSTDNAPINVTASFNNDKFSVSIYSPLVAQRAYTRIAVDSQGIANSNCAYPGPFWTHTVAGCTDRFVGDMPWATTNPSCGWAFNNSDADYYQYTANMVIDHKDELSTFAGRGNSITLRDTQHVIPLLLQFQKYVEVSTTIYVQSPVRLLVAVVRQQVDPITKNAIIELATNLLYPYKINTNTLSQTPTGTPMSFVLSEISNAAECPNSNTSTCTQRFLINITTNGACTITGAYGITYGLVCQSGATECTISAGATANITANIISEDFCPKVSARVTITGTLTAYGANDYTTPRSSFIVDQVSYYQAVVTSPQATLTEAKVTSISVVNADNSAESYLLYSGAIPNPTFVDSAKLTVEAPGSDNNKFFFTLNSSVLMRRDLFTL